MHSRILTLVALLCAPLAAYTSPQVPTTEQAVLTADQRALFAEADRGFQAGHFAEALPKFLKLHAALPDDATFTKFAVEAAINTGNLSQAQSLLDTVLAASPDDPQALGLEVHLYGQQRDAGRRDALLATMQQLHDAGKLRFDSVILETQPAADGGRIVFVDFLKPFSRFHIVTMARYLDADGHLEKSIALESDDIDQIQFAKDHPREAEAGIRIYSMDSYSAQKYSPDGKTVTQTHGTLCPLPGCFMAGRPSYEFFRAHVLQPSGPPSASTTTRAPAQP